MSTGWTGVAGLPGVARRPRLIGLQWLRGISALLVVLFHVHVGAMVIHSAESSFRLFEFGAAGVDIFFVLSGFIIYYVHRRDIGRRERGVDFLKRRVLRIYPVYWALTLAMLVAASALSLDRLMYKVDLSLILHSLFLVPTAGRLLIVPVAWSLTHEVFFYGLFLAAIALPRRIAIGVIGLVAAMTLVNVLGLLPISIERNPIQRSFTLGFIFSPYNLQFLLGVGVGILFTARDLRRHRWTLLSLGSGLFTVAALLVQHGAIDLGGDPHTIVARVVLFGLAGASLVLGLAVMEIGASSWAGRLLTYLGDASYSIYLVHQPVIFAVFLALQGFVFASGPLLDLLCLAIATISVVLGCLCHAWLEEPLNRWTRRRFIQRPPASAPTPVLPVAEPAGSVGLVPVVPPASNVGQ